MQPQVTTPFYRNTRFLLIVVVLCLITIVGIFIALAIYNSSTRQPDASTRNNYREAITSTSEATTTRSQPMPPVIWSFNGNAWSSMGNAPECDEPFELETVTNFDLATNILYPGQVRGGNFKPHGGVRFDNSANNSINVYLPYAAVPYRGSRYIESGEVQYMIDFLVPCGYMMRFDHISKPAPTIQKYVDQLPQPTESSATTNFTGVELIDGDTLIATEVGFKSNLNVSFDFGLYDLRAPNQVSQTNPNWVQITSGMKELPNYALCWLDYLSAPDQAKAKSLPGSGTEGKQSYYCK